MTIDEKKTDLISIGNTFIDNLFEPAVVQHSRTKGSKNGIRLYQNKDGTWTELGKERRRKGTGRKSREEIASELQRNLKKDVFGFHSSRVKVDGSPDSDKKVTVDVYYGKDKGDLNKKTKEVANYLSSRNIDNEKEKIASERYSEQRGISKDTYKSKLTLKEMSVDVSGNKHEFYNSWLDGEGFCTVIGDTRNPRKLDMDVD